MHKSQSLFCLITVLHVSAVTITHLQEHKTTVTTVSSNHYTVIDRVKVPKFEVPNEQPTRFGFEVSTEQPT